MFLLFSLTYVVELFEIHWTKNSRTWDSHWLNLAMEYTHTCIHCSPTKHDNIVWWLWKYWKLIGKYNIKVCLLPFWFLIYKFIDHLVFNMFPIIKNLCTKQRKQENSCFRYIWYKYFKTEIILKIMWQFCILKLKIEINVS